MDYLRNVRWRHDEESCAVAVSFAKVAVRASCADNMLSFLLTMSMVWRGPTCRWERKCLRG